MTKNKRIFSFDIFDTCFVRTCGSSTNVYYLLAENILGANADSSLKRDFALVRKMSEEIARKKLINKQKEEVTLKEIYQFCNFNNFTNINNNIIMQKELEIEDEILLPIYDTRKEIELLHNTGYIIMYISDMYLPKDFIVKKLRDFDFYYDEKLVYVSSEVNKTKENGSLYEYIQKENNIDYRCWVHTGDNKQSDFKAPKNKGIKAKLAKTNYNIYEKTAINLGGGNGVFFEDYAFSLSRAIRLTYESNPQNMFAANFIAPIFVPFTYSILSDAKERGIENLYFIARDGYILYLIAKIFSSKFPFIKLHYLYASRKSLYLPGIEKLSFNAIKDIVPLDKGIKGILYALQMEDFDYSHLSIKGLSSVEILKLLLDDKSFVDNLTKQYQKQNTLCAKYFNQEGLSNPNCAIVDMLGSRRCHMYINNILRYHKMPEIFAYYYEVTPKRIFGGGKYSAQNYQEEDIHSGLYHHVSQPLCEQYFCITNQQRTIGYQEINKIVKPIFEIDPIESNYKEKTYNSNKIILQAYAEHFIKHPVANPVIYIKKAQFCLNMFYHNPMREYLDAFDGFFCTDGNSKYALLQKHNLLYIIIHHNKYYRWKEGNIIFNSGILYKLIRSFLSIRLLRLIYKK